MIRSGLIRKTYKRYKSDKNGQFAVIFAIAAFPLLLLGTLLLDFSNSLTAKTVISSALDDAALAAASDQTITSEERADYAEQYFWANSDFRNAKIEFSVLEASKERVELTARATLPTAVSGALGLNEISVASRAVAKVTHGDVICILALDPDGSGSFFVTEGAEFSAETCSVQVNSDHKSASIVDGAAIATAKDFCVTGGAKGTYTPFVNTQCGTIEDPYASLGAPPEEDCIDQDDVSSRLSHWHADVQEHGVTLLPGTYCGGLNLQGKVVNFAPGTYVMQDGPLIIGLGSRIKAEGVTFALNGKDSVLDVADGSHLKIVAPEDGPYAGLAFYQNSGSNLGKTIEVTRPESIIRSGGNVSITGTAYFPTQNLTFIGGSILATQAPATSFIAHRVEIRDGARISVAVDHVASGLPPILPRSDESVRLAE